MYKKTSFVNKIFNTITHAGTQYIHDFNLGLRLKVRTNHPVVNRLLLSSLCSLRVDNHKIPDLELAITTFSDTNKLPIKFMGKPAIFLKRIISGNSNAISFLKDIDKNIFLAINKNYYYLCDCHKGKAICFISTESLKEKYPLLYLPFFYLPFIIQAVRRFKSMIKLHAAIVSKNGKFFLFPGKSGSGKSTLSLNLAKLGFDCYHDDSAYFFESGKSVYGQVIPVFRMVSKGQDYAQIFFSSANTQKGLKTTYRYLCFRPNTIIFPFLSKSRKSELVSVSKDEALFRIIPQSGFGAKEKGNIQEKIGILKALVEQCACFLLKSGSDIKSDRARLYTILRPIMENNK